MAQALRTVPTAQSSPTPAAAPTLADQQAVFTQQQILIATQAQMVRDIEASLSLSPPVPPAPATANGTAAASPNGNQLTVTSVSGVIVAEAVISGGGIPANTTILGQMSGTVGDAGVYLTSQPTTASNAALSFQAPTPPPGVPPPSTNLAQIIDTQAALIRLQVAYIDNLQTLVALNP